MNLSINNLDNRPLYEQLVSQIKNQILSGALPAGAPLPSMRALANELHVSVITTKRTYEELEREGLIESYVGKGSFVKIQSLMDMQRQIRKDIEAKIEEAYTLAMQAGIDTEELVEMIREKGKEK